jgi:hypothetical protein
MSEANSKTPVVRITIPKDARELEKTKTRIEFKLDSGRAKPVAEALRKALDRDGWKEKLATLNDQAGTIAFDKGEQSLTLLYTDTGVIPAEVSISVIRAELAPVEPE